MANAQLNVLDWINAGEGQAVEFKVRFPDQARDLAKEIAAFATSNDGVILIGVGDDGSVAGIADAGTNGERDVWQRRVQGTCASIKPPVTPRLEFATLDDAQVMLIHVPKGSAPLYYVQGTPYVRHITSARPAEPQEVIDLVLAWSKRGEEEKPSPEAEFLGGLASMLVAIIVRTSEAGIREREVDPWFEELRTNLEFSADRVRAASIETPSELADLAPRLDELADALDAAAHQRMGIGYGWDQYHAAAVQAGELAQAIKAEWIDSKPINEASVEALAEMVDAEIRALIGLEKRAQSMSRNGRLKDLQSDAASRAYKLLQAVAFGVGLGGAERRAKIEASARALRQVETQEVYMDGGQSVAEIIGNISAAVSELQALSIKDAVDA